MNDVKDLYRISAGVQQWVEQHAGDGLVVELGGGNGSRYLHERVANCITIENDEGWAKTLAEQGVPHIHAPLVDGWYDMTDEVTELLRTADVLIIDGPTGPHRHACEARLHLVKDGAVVVFDDTHRMRNLDIVRRCHAHGWELLKRLICPFGRHTHIMRKHGTPTK